ncbi:MAG: hypothetical protein M1818_006516 [Claussenomyces sp. TS43310]|nr:MAG: hypothetical protein M1818_006516 [Claussenomyces sp. TS43310]
MSDQTSSAAASVDDFFIRSGLKPQVRADCDKLLAEAFPGRSIRPATTQGYCSYTVLAGNDLVVQFRPPNYQLDLRITAAAQDVYRSFAPSTKLLTTLSPSGLLVYTMERIRGISYKDFRLNNAAQSVSEAAKVREKLSRDFASFLACSWHHRDHVALTPGRIGTSIRQRLQRLVLELPSLFRPIASHVLSQLEAINALPWVLTHGDIVTSNIMIDPYSGKLLGFVDWAEAELLPFGVCLYGLEEILGYMTTEGFVYHDDAEQCRTAFWTTLHREIPRLAETTFRNAVLLARDLGVLLWHGFAFDDGAINRVVQMGKDCTEILYLEAFLQPQRSKPHL